MPELFVLSTATEQKRHRCFVYVGDSRCKKLAKYWVYKWALSEINEYGDMLVCEIHAKKYKTLNNVSIRLTGSQYYRVFQEIPIWIESK